MKCIVMFLTLVVTVLPFGCTSQGNTVKSGNLSFNYLEKDVPSIGKVVVTATRDKSYFGPETTSHAMFVEGENGRMAHVNTVGAAAEGRIIGTVKSGVQGSLGLASFGAIGKVPTTRINNHGGSNTANATGGGGGGGGGSTSAAATPTSGVGASSPGGTGGAGGVLPGP